MYDPSTSRWRWSVNNIELPPNTPWFAPSATNTVSRVLIRYGSPLDATWRTVSNTQLHRYICEVYTNIIQLNLKSFLLNEIRSLKKGTSANSSSTMLQS